jgi:hypothetical protein
LKNGRSAHFHSSSSSSGNRADPLQRKHRPTTHRHTAIPTTSITGVKKRRRERGEDQKNRETKRREKQKPEKRKDKRRGNEQKENRGEGARATSDFTSSSPAQVSFFFPPFLQF